MPFPSSGLFPGASLFPGAGVAVSAGTIAGQSTVAGTLRVLCVLSGTIPAQSVVSGTLAGPPRALAGSIPAQSALPGTALAIRSPLVASVVAQSALFATLAGGVPVVPAVPPAGPGKFILRDVVVTVDGVDASGYVHGVSVEQERDSIDITSFADQSYRNYLPGELQATFSLDMFADNGSATAQTLRLAQTLGSTVFVAVKPHRDFESARNPAYAANCVVASYEPLDAPVGDAAQSTATLRSTGAVQIIGIAVLAGQIDARAGLQATHTLAPTIVSATTVLSPSTFLGP